MPSPTGRRVLSIPVIGDGGKGEGVGQDKEVCGALELQA